MELALVIWAVGTLPGVASGICFGAFLFTILSLIAWIGCKISETVAKDEKEKKELGAISKLARTIFLFSFPIWFVTLLVPDKTTAYQMLAAYGVQTVAENPKAQELASDGVDVLQALMKKAKSELEKESK